MPSRLPFTVGRTVVMGIKVTCQRAQQHRLEKQRSPQLNASVLFEVTYSIISYCQSFLSPPISLIRFISVCPSQLRLSLPIHVSSSCSRLSRPFISSCSNLSLYVCHPFFSYLFHPSHKFSTVISFYSYTCTSFYYLSIHIFTLTLYINTLCCFLLSSPHPPVNLSCYPLTLNIGLHIPFFTHPLLPR